MLIKLHSLYQFSMRMHKVLGPGEHLERKSHKRLNEIYDEQQPLDNINEIKKNFQLSLGQRFRYGFMPEELSESNDMVRKALSLDNANPREILQYRIDQAIKKYQKWPLDTGSYQVKAAVLSERVIQNISHMESNRQDKKGYRNLMLLLRARRTVFQMVKRENYHMYKMLLNDYGIIDFSFGDPKHLEYKHNSAMKTKKYDIIETNRGRM